MSQGIVVSIHLAPAAGEPMVSVGALTQKGVLRGLVHRGGLRAEILTEGVIRVGDPIRES